MKTIYIKGGLGNQMFQYAYGRALELAGNKIFFNTLYFYGNKPARDTVRNFKLNNFNLETKAKFLNKNHLISSFINIILTKLHIKGDGYWQSEKYFKNIESELRKEFTFKNELSQFAISWQNKIISTSNSISLHIRRGDYVEDKKTNSFHGTCDGEYYKKALEILNSKINTKNIEIFIFSDDIEWAKTNLHYDYPTHFVSNLEIPDYEEMYLMSLCKHNIIANSSFSWWSAWLNQNNGKIVIAPKQWTVKKTSDELDILPKSWIQI